MVTRRFQFTLSGILWATFWIAIWIGTWVALARTKDVRLAALLIPVWLATPCIAAGALAGRTWLGVRVGAIVALVLLFLALLFTMH